ncbi:MAG: DUF2723 domain-containing protein [Chloroflexi bacterium]|nr:DUF2723 domain-containing protein [Chloroflexota bacterium]
MLPAVVAVLAFAVYVGTLSSGVLGGDAGELQFVPPILGLTHPTGYPFQVLLHAAWSHLPLGSVAFRLNLLDALFAAATIGMLAVVIRQLGTGLAGPALGAATLAFGELWWSQAVRGDKYTLNALVLAVVVALYLRWLTRPDWRWLVLLSFAYGLSLTHHRSMLLVAPALLAGVLLGGWRPRSWREPFALTALSALPLVLYAYVPWAGARGLPPGSWPVDTPAAFVTYLLDAGYTSQVRPDASLLGRIAEEAQVLTRSFGPVGAVLGVVGLGWSICRRKTAALVLLLIFLPQAILGASYHLQSNYELPRHWVFYLPAFLIWAVWIGLGTDALIGGIRRVIPENADSAVVVGMVMLVLLQAGTAWVRGARTVIRAELGATSLDDWRQDLQRSPLAARFGTLALDLAAPDAIIVCDWEQATVLWYYQQVEGRRSDVTISYPIDTLDGELVRGKAESRAVYLARTLPGVEQRGVTSSLGPLLQLWPSPGSRAPDAATPIGASFEAGLTLAGVAYHMDAFNPGSVVPFTLYWRAERPLDTAYAVSVRLIGPDGAVHAQHDERHPALGTSPTNAWRLGQIVGDYHELPIGNRLGPGTYRVRIVVYAVDPPRELHVMTATGANGEPFVDLPPIAVAPRPWSDLRGRLLGILAR